MGRDAVVMSPTVIEFAVIAQLDALEPFGFQSLVDRPPGRWVRVHHTQQALALGSRHVGQKIALLMVLTLNAIATILSVAFVFSLARDMRRRTRMGCHCGCLVESGLKRQRLVTEAEPSNGGTPDIEGTTIVRVLVTSKAPDLWCPKGLGSTPVVARPDRVLKHGLHNVCHAKVGNLECAAFGQDQILRLDISVRNTHLVQVLEPQQQLLEKTRAFHLGHGGALVQ